MVGALGKGWPPPQDSSPAVCAGAYLFACGKAESKIGESQKRFEEKVIKDVVTPLKAFLEIDIKSILVREREGGGGIFIFLLLLFLLL